MRKLTTLPMMLATLLLLLAHQAVAWCEAGYRCRIDPSISSSNSSLRVKRSATKKSIDNAPFVPTPFNSASAVPFIFTDLLETDFLHLQDLAADTDWRRQEYNVSAADARGPFGMEFSLDNIYVNPYSSHMNWSGPGVLGGDPGLQLRVSGGPISDGFVRVAQINSVREDMTYGSYRALVKMSPLPGTCFAMFWYYNNSQEVDMEFLPKQFMFTNGTFLVNLVHQSPQSAAQGFSTIGKDYQVASLPFDPTDAYHEYRIDYIPGTPADKIIFYAGNHVLAVMDSYSPAAPGHLILTHWSNGDPGWTAGPPSADSIMSVAYVKAYFNSSNPARQADAVRRAPDPSVPGAICDIEDYVTPINDTFTFSNPSNISNMLSEFFFNRPNMTNNQSVYGHVSNADRVGEKWWLYEWMEWVVLLQCLWFVITWGPF